MKKRTTLLVAILIAFSQLKASVILVDVNSPVIPALQNGLLWATAYSNLQTAINSASSGDEIWVASGTYQPAVASTSFTMKDGVKVYGGFTSFLTLFTSRNWVTNVTTLQGNGTAVVAYTATAPATTVLDGFKITGGTVHGGIDNNAGGSATFSNLIVTNNTATASYGGGMTNAARGNPTLNNIVFSSNTAPAGGGFYYATNSFGGGLTLTNVTFSNNTATGANGGGGFYNSAGGSSEKLTFNGVVFDGNTATIGLGGGAIFQNANALSQLNGDRIVFINNTVSTSSANPAGGGFLSISGYVKLTNSVFYNNSVSAANGNGGAFATTNGAAVVNSRDTLINITFINNSATGTGSAKGGAIYDNTNGGSAPQNMYIVNSVFYGNTKGSGATSSDIEYGNNNVYITLTNNYMQSAIPVATLTHETVAGNVVNTANPFSASTIDLANLKGSDGIWMSADDGLHLLSASAAYDAGSNTEIATFGITNDITVTNRIQNAIVDMGAYEGLGASALPVKLISFSGLLKNGAAQLQWRTGIEDGFNHFELEKSIDGMNYTAVSNIQAKGSDNSYNNNVTQAETVAYYRLKIVDNDGHFTFSNILRLSQSVNTSLQVYPNPAQDLIAITINEDGIAKIYDVAGRLEKVEQVRKGINSIDISGLGKGIHSVETNGKKAQFVKL